MMINCKKACVGVQYPRGVSSTFSKLAYSACGWWGVAVTDASIIFTLIGVCISYEITFSQLMKDIPFLNPFFSLPASYQVVCLTYLCGVLSYPLCCVRNVAFLSPVSLGALLCLLVGIIAIIMFGEEEEWSSRASEIVTPLQLWPEDASHLTTFVGIAIFCFGLCTAAFPVEESMSHRDQFAKALKWCVMFVCSVYALVGIAIAVLYSRHPDGIKGNILQNLPQHSATAALVRTCLSIVCILSFPLALVPPAQMIEQLLLQSKLQLTFGGSAYQRITSSPPMITDDEDEFQEPPVTLRAACRLGLVTVCTILAANVPCFGFVVSLLGCFTVSILSFVLPPLLHLMLVTIPESQHYALNLSQPFIITRHVVSDSLLLALGVITFVCATGITAMEAFNGPTGDASC